MAATHPLACGNGLSLLDSMEKAIHTVMWLKRKLNPFDVINVSITAFAHKISMEIIEKGVILWRKCLGMTYWILFLPEYQYSVCVLQQLQNYMIFHWAERLKLLYYTHEKRLMVRYFLRSNEQPLQFTAEVMRNFLSFTWQGLSVATVGGQKRFIGGMGHVDIWFMKNDLKRK